EEEVEQELDQPLPELVQTLARVEVEEAEQVDEQERSEEDEHPGDRPRHAPTPRQRERDEEQERQHVGERDVARDVPVHLLERDAEDARQEEEARQPFHFRSGAGQAGSSALRGSVEPTPRLMPGPPGGARAPRRARAATPC